MNKVMRKDTIVYRFIDDFYMAYEKFKKCHGHKVGAFADEIWLLVRNLHANMQEIEKQEDGLCDKRDPVPLETSENRAHVFEEWVEIYERFRKEVQESVDRTNNELVDFAIRTADEKSNRTATEAKKFEEEGPKMAEAALKAIESINNVTD